MRVRTATLVAWSLWMVTLTFGVLTLALMFANNPSSASQGWYLAPFLAFATGGALIASRRPRNPIGWLACSIGPLFLLGTFAGQYAIYTLLKMPGSLPAGEIMAWLGSGWVSSTGWGLMVTFLLLLFPTGRLPSRRWRPVAWVTASLLVVLVVAVALRPGLSVDDYPSYSNPLPIEVASATVDQVLTIVYPLMLIMIVACVASVMVRLRRAKDDERQQLKWFTYAAFLLIIRYGIQLLLPFLQIHLSPWLSDVLWAMAIAALPIAIGIAVLKYRLYDIDIIINRTIVYATLTAILALVYWGSVVLLQRLTTPLISSESPLVIVASTLVIAALFQPLRRRIQTAIDRRFYRRKYDSQRVLESFAARLRQETDLDAMTHDMLAVVQDTLQPAHASLWLRDGRQRSPSDPSRS